MTALTLPLCYTDYPPYGGSDYSGGGRGGYEGGGGRGRGGPAGRGGRPRQRDDKVHDSIIEERINRERPCRTLFIRNIKVSRAPGVSTIHATNYPRSTNPPVMI